MLFFFFATFLKKWKSFAGRGVFVAHKHFRGDLVLVCEFLFPVWFFSLKIRGRRGKELDIGWSKEWVQFRGVGGEGFLWVKLFYS